MLPNNAKRQVLKQLPKINKRSFLSLTLKEIDTYVSFLKIANIESAKMFKHAYFCTNSKNLHHIKLIYRINIILLV